MLQSKLVRHNASKQKTVRHVAATQRA